MSIKLCLISIFPFEFWHHYCHNQWWASNFEHSGPLLAACVRVIPASTSWNSVKKKHKIGPDYWLFVLCQNLWQGIVFSQFWSLIHSTVTDMFTIQYAQNSLTPDFFSVILPDLWQPVHEKVETYEEMRDIRVIGWPMCLKTCLCLLSLSQKTQKKPLCLFCSVWHRKTHTHIT